ncbi:MAG: hypothetical protein QM742_17995 [Aquabacterium sp.]
MKFKALLASLALSTVAASTHAGDPKVPSQDRKAIIAGLRAHPSFGHLQDMKLDVRRIWVSPQLAYLCALPIGKDKRYAQTDGMFDVVQVAFRREGERWVPTARVDGLSETLKQVQCMAPPDGEITEAFVEALVNNPGLRP